MKRYIKACLLLIVVMAVMGTGCKKDDAGFKHDPSSQITVDEIFPEKGSGGTEILINGSNFTTDTSQVKVTLNGNPLKIIGASGKQLMVLVPKKAGSGVITVTVNGKTATSKSIFAYEYTRTASTLAGSGIAGFTNGKGTDASFNFSSESWYRCSGIVVDDNLNVYVTDVGNHCIRKIDKEGNVTTFAGDPYQGGFADGKGTAAKFSIPYGLTIDPAGNLYVADPGNWDLRKITPDGTATLYAMVTDPWAIAFDRKTGNVFYASCVAPATVYQVTPERVITPSATGLIYPSAMTFDSEGNMFVNVHGEMVIRKFLAGNWTGGDIVAGSGAVGYLDGPALTAQFSLPWGMAIDAQNNLYVAGNGASGGGWGNADQSIRYLDGTTYEVSTFAGSGSAGNLNGIGKAASFNAPAGVAVDKNGTVYVLDRNNNSVRKIVSE